MVWMSFAALRKCISPSHFLVTKMSIPLLRCEHGNSNIQLLGHIGKVKEEPDMVLSCNYRLAEQSPMLLAMWLPGEMG